MAGIKEYIFGVIAAAILCAIITQLTPKDSFCTAAVKMICGVFMVLALIAPIFNVSIKLPNEIFADISREADVITSAAAVSTQESVGEIITQRVQTYILDKAKEYGVSLTVDVTLSDDAVPTPVAVHLRGDIAPYTKRILAEVIENDLGITMEAQIWN